MAIHEEGQALVPKAWQCVAEAGVELVARRAGAWPPQAKSGVQLTP